MAGWTKSILAVFGLVLAVVVIGWPLAAQEEDREPVASERVERDEGERQERDEGERQERDERRRDEDHRDGRERLEAHVQLEVAGHAAQLLVTAGIEDVAAVVEGRIEQLERRIEHERSRDRDRDGGGRRNDEDEDEDEGELREFLEHISQRLDDLSRRVDELTEERHERHER